MPHTIKSKAMLALFALMAVLLFAALACGGAATPETIVVEKEVLKEVTKEVVVETEVIKEVEKEVTPTPKPVTLTTQGDASFNIIGRSGTELFVFSNSSPHVTVIEVPANLVKLRRDLPDFTSWTWNDDNNYFDGTNLWLGMKDPDTNDVEVIALNLDTLVVTARFPIGKDTKTLYIGKATRNGVLLVGKMGSGQVVAIDTKARRVLSTWDVPVHGDVVCDADISVGPDGVERFFYPTRGGDTLVSLNVASGETLKIVNTPEGFKPHMMTIAPNGTVWVQEAASNSNSVFDPVTLELLKRIPTGKVPVVNTFSPDGKLSYIGHAKDTIVTVIDTETLEEIQRIEVGTNPRKLAVSPDGKFVYAVLKGEGSVAVIDTGSWKVTEKIGLGTNADGVFLREGPQ